MPIKYLPKGKKILSSPIAKSIKEGNCYDAWNFVACHCENGSSQIQGIDFDKSYSPVTHAESLIINIDIASIHIITASILDVINTFQNKNVPIH